MGNLALQQQQTISKPIITRRLCLEAAAALASTVSVMSKVRLLML